MLPQMMPLPWLMVFFMIFFCFFSVSMLLNFCFLDCSPSAAKEKVVKEFFVNMPW